MKQIILIVLAIIAGRYIDAPIWQTAFAVAGAVWAMNQMNSVRCTDDGGEE